MDTREKERERENDVIKEFDKQNEQNRKYVLGKERWKEKRTINSRRRRRKRANKEHPHVTRIIHMLHVCTHTWMISSSLVYRKCDCKIAQNDRARMRLQGEYVQVPLPSVGGGK